MQNTIDALVGKECWGVIGGSGTGSMIDLLIGSKLKRDRSLKNMRLSEDERFYDGEFSLFIKYCSWRMISIDGGLLCSSKSDNSLGGELMLSLERLRSKKIVSVHLNEITLDLDIVFEGNLLLSIFCDCMSDDNDGDNYSITYNGMIYVSGAGSKIIVERQV